MLDDNPSTTASANTGSGKALLMCHGFFEVFRSVVGVQFRACAGDIMWTKHQALAYSYIVHILFGLLMVMVVHSIQSLSCLIF